MYKSIALFFCVALFQRSSAQVDFGIFAGPQITTAQYSIKDENQPTDIKYGAQAGATIKIPFENKLYFAPAVYYSMKGYKVRLNRPSYPPTELARNNSTTVHTIETAFLLNYDLTNKPSHFFLKFGPAIDIAFSGHESFETTTNENVSRSMKFAYTSYGRFTAQAILQFGYRAKSGLFAFAHYGHGLGSMNNADEGPKIHHRIAGLSIGKYIHRGIK